MIYYFLAFVLIERVKESAIAESTSAKIYQGWYKTVVAGPASARPLFWPSMLSAVSLFLVSAHFTYYSDFIQSAKIY